MSPLDLKKQVKLCDLENIFWSIQTAVATSDENPVENFKEYIVGNDTAESEVYTQMVLIFLSALVFFYQLIIL